MLTFLDEFPYQGFHFPRLGVPPVAVLGVHQFAVHFHFKCSPGGGDQRQFLDARLKGSQQFRCQTGSFLGVVSNRAVFNGDVHRNDSRELFR